MATQAVKRGVAAALVLIGIALWLTAAFLMAQSVQNSAQFSALHIWILLINAAGLIVLMVLIAGRLVRLVRAWRERAVGSRLEARMVWTFGALAIVPIFVLFYFSVEFINRGIDSWFHVEVRQGLEDALSLSRAAFALRMREGLERTQFVADELERTQRNLVTVVSQLRPGVGASELTVFGSSGRILATSSDRSEDLLPLRPSNEIVWQVRQGRPYVNLEPIAGGGYFVRTAVALRGTSAGGEQRLLQAIYPVEGRMGELADTVEAAYQEYAEKARLREPLKTSFRLTLTLVLMMATFAALYGAFWAARRLVQPIQSLVKGTRAVAQGDLDLRLPLPSHDELGMLVHSFNDMTKRLLHAREEAQQSQAEVEAERANLAVILARLSTGVISLEPDLTIRTINQAAVGILAGDGGDANLIGKALDAAAVGAPLFEQFVQACRTHLDHGEADWREQIALRSDTARRTLMCACTALPGEADHASGYVLVFDDITALLQAQRDAAWGEVARRLAHEIKNPLTPIRLSAERLRHKLLEGMNPHDAQILERATYTIVQQVEAMKEMVNAFSEYARTPKMDLTAFDLNQLVTEVTDLYRAQDRGADAAQTARRQLQVMLDPKLSDAGHGAIEADRGRLRQLLHNLLANACEALEGRDNARLQVVTQFSARTTGAVAEIVVEDNGPGFAADVIERLFDPYVTTKPKGTGLGLAIVKKIVEEHGGRIEAQNIAGQTGEPVGARVRIELPLLAANRAAPRPVREAVVESRRERA